MPLDFGLELANEVDVAVIRKRLEPSKECLAIIAPQHAVEVNDIRETHRFRLEAEENREHVVLGIISAVNVEHFGSSVHHIEKHEDMPAFIGVVFQPRPEVIAVEQKLLPRPDADMFAGNPSVILRGSGSCRCSINVSFLPAEESVGEKGAT